LTTPAGVRIGCSGGWNEITATEALRELGRFEEAVRLLAQDIDPRMKRAATFIRDLATKGDPQLKEFPST